MVDRLHNHLSLDLSPSLSLSAGSSLRLTAGWQASAKRIRTISIANADYTALLSPEIIKAVPSKQGREVK